MNKFFWTGMVLFTVGVVLFTGHFVLKHAPVAQLTLTSWTQIPESNPGTIASIPSESGKLWFDGKNWVLIDGTCSEIFLTKLLVTPSASPVPNQASPLFTLGAPGLANILALKPNPDGTFQVGMDRWGKEFALGNPFRPEQQTFELDVMLDRINRRVVAQADGVTVFEKANQPWPFDPQAWAVGVNAFGGSYVSATFDGRVKVLGATTDPDRGVNPVAFGERGDVCLRVSFQFPIFGQGQPLVQWGEAGRADLFYVSAIDSTHLSFGLDHWGVGQPRSPSIPYDPRVPHTIVVRCEPLRVLGGLAPASDRTFSVLLDGVAVLKGTCNLYPARAAELTFGANTVGASTAEKRFAGKIFHQGLTL